MLDYNIYLETPITCIKLNSCLDASYLYMRYMGMAYKTQHYDLYTGEFDYNSDEYNHRRLTIGTPGSHPNSGLMLYESDHEALSKLYEQAYEAQEASLDIKPYKFNKIRPRGSSITVSGTKNDTEITPTKQKRYRPCHY